MEELSLHILDIVENSIRAGAEHIAISLEESSKADRVVLTITDDGKGMTKEQIEHANDPFTTTKKGKHVGLGIPLLEQAATQASGELTITKAPKKGLIVRATFRYGHIDRQPLGDMRTTMLTLITSYPDKDFYYRHKTDTNEFTFDTKEIKSQLDGIDITNPEVIKTLRGLLKDETVL